MPAFLGQENGNPYLDSLVYELTLPGYQSASGTEYLNRYLKPYHAAVLEETLLSDIKISAWMTVTSDETLLSCLIQQYFLHQFSFWPFFYNDFFWGGS